MRVAVVSAVLCNPHTSFAANVTVNVTSNLFPVATPAYGMHVSVYANEIGNANLPSRFIEPGVNYLRYPGGGYADG